MRFYLGTHESGWLERLEVPLFVSHRRLRRRKRLPRAVAPWALDSGGFTELDRPPHRWVTTVPEYLEAVERYASEIGHLDWAAPMDWMCEPWIVQKTGLSVAEHQHRTVANYLELRDRGPFVPVLQGWTLRDYEACLGLYEDAGVDLRGAAVVGLGSICRRQSTAEIGAIVGMLHEEGIRAHGFGVKRQGLGRYGHLLRSADSLAWSFDARRSDPLPGCTHKACNNCRLWALRWREQTLAEFDELEASRALQMVLC